MSNRMTDDEVASLIRSTESEALKVLGFVERFGVGLAIANRRLAANGNPPLQYEVQNSYVLVRLQRSAS